MWHSQVGASNKATELYLFISKLFQKDYVQSLIIFLENVFFSKRNMIFLIFWCKHDTVEVFFFLHCTVVGFYHNTAVYVAHKLIGVQDLFIIEVTLRVLVYDLGNSLRVLVYD